MRKQHIVIAGSSGLIGQALHASFARDGVRITRLVRRDSHNEDERTWRPGVVPLDPEYLSDATEVVNLAGASIARMPWTRRYRQELITSRLQTTRTLAQAINSLGQGSPRLISASAVGYYGNRPGELLTEAASVGRTFLARLCYAWEEAALEARASTSVTLLRTAPVLDPRGVLKPLIPLTRFGLAGPLGSGNQHWPWISLTDEVAAIRHIIDHGLEGPINLAGPTPATESEIVRELAGQLHRPFLVPAPRFALRGVLGRDAADGLLLSDEHVVPRRLRESGFSFTHRTPRDAIASSLRQ